jgi:hypothetical protein
MMMMMMMIICGRDSSACAAIMHLMQQHRNQAQHSPQFDQPLEMLSSLSKCLWCCTPTASCPRLAVSLAVQQHARNNNSLIKQARSINECLLNSTNRLNSSMHSTPSKAAGFCLLFHTHCVSRCMIAAQSNVQHAWSMLMQMGSKATV